MSATIIRAGDEDLTLHVRRIGRFVVVVTERPGIARSVERAIVGFLAPPAGTQKLEPAIGFRAIMDE